MGSDSSKQKKNDGNRPGPSHGRRDDLFQTETYRPSPEKKDKDKKTKKKDTNNNTDGRTVPQRSFPVQNDRQNNGGDWLADDIWDESPRDPYNGANSRNYLDVSPNGQVQPSAHPPGGQYGHVALPPYDTIDRNQFRPAPPTNRPEPPIIRVEPPTQPEEEPITYRQQQQEPVHVEVVEQPPRQPSPQLQPHVRHTDSPLIAGNQYEVGSLLLSTPDEPYKEGNKRVHYKETYDDDEYIGANLRFYRNQIAFRPNGEYIDHIHKYWYGDYRRLDQSHYYIQWLFPLPERSRVNPHARTLQKHEAKCINDDTETRTRVVKSYKLILDFFGMTLKDEWSGQVSRSKNWKNRYVHIDRTKHNAVRMTRVIKSLGALGFVQYQAPLVMMLLHEVIETRQLRHISVDTIHHWIRAMDNDFDRRYILSQFQNGLDKISKVRKRDNNARLISNNDFTYRHIDPRFEPRNKEKRAHVAARPSMFAIQPTHDYG